MTRTTFLHRLLYSFLLSVASPVFSQETLISVSVEPTGAPYQVDGVLYYKPTSFTWPTGSKHFLEIMSYCGSSPTLPVPDVCQTRYTPLIWTTNNGPIDSSTAVITADPRIIWYKGASTVEHRVRVSFFDAGGGTDSIVAFPATKCIGPKPSAGGPGIACAGGVCSKESFEVWLRPGQIGLEAIPYDGFAFAGWYTGSSPQPFVDTYTIRGPIVLHPRFEPAKRVQIITDPPQLRVLVDHQEIITSDPQNYVPTCSAPGFFDFAEGSTHVLGAPSPQVDINGKEWVFDSWSIGGGQNTIYKADRANIPEKLIARFVSGIRVSLLIPQGLKLIVDGRDTWPSYNFIWGAGTKHVISAPAEQTGHNGRKYVFKRWSNGGPAVQEITLDRTDTTGLRFIAEYAILGMVRVQSNMPVEMLIGQDTCSTPCTLHREIGSELRVAAPRTVPVSEGTRLELVTLDGDTSNVASVKLGEESVTLSASYRVTYRVAAVADPPQGADIRIEPSADEAFYPANTRVQVYSTSRLGYRFKRWEGDTTERFSPATVTVSGPMRLRAVLEAVAEISKAGVRNGAGETPVAAVAPGSIISIYGANLAPESVAGSSNPLVQTLAGVTVQVAGRILPLFFVSPEQINAQLPYDLPEGKHTLTIRGRQIADVTAAFDVARNAPGLFTTMHGDLPVAAIVRSAGKPINSENPIGKGDVINVFGTGFGPHRIDPPEGFGAEESDAFRLADTVEVLFGDQVLTPEYAGVATGLPGVVVVRFRVPADLTQSGVTSLSVRVNGTTTNNTVLPIGQDFDRNTTEETAQ